MILTLGVRKISKGLRFTSFKVKDHKADTSVVYNGTIIGHFKGDRKDSGVSYNYPLSDRGTVLIQKVHKITHPYHLLTYG